MRTTVLAVLTAVVLTATAMPARGDVNVGINVGTPAPPPVIVAPPQLVVVPGTPVYFVPSAAFNVFVFGGKYYSFHNGVWFLASGHKGPWKVIALESVPQPVRGVPISYYKIPPGHAKKMAGQDGGPPGHGKGGKGKKGRQD